MLKRLGYRFDYIQHTANPSLSSFSALIAQVDPATSPARRPICVMAWTTTLYRKVKSLFGISGNILHGNDHFIHGGGQLIRLDFLPGHGGTGLFNHRLQLLGSIGNA